MNVDVRESNLISRDVQEAKAAFVKPNSANSIETANTFSNNPRDDEKKQKLWLYLILLIVAIFMFESFYANQNYKFPGSDFFHRSPPFFLSEKQLVGEINQCSERAHPAAEKPTK